MKISMRWLAEWVAVPDADQTARALTERGLEVEGIERRGDNLAGVVVAAVRARQPVAGSDHLTLVEIFDGVSVHQVVCGAPNVPAPGGRVAWARPGTTLPGGLSIGVRELRGVRSAGMLCSEQELGLGDSHAGIIVLEADAEAGREVATELMLRDVVLEVNVTPNRGDCLSHLGIAREVGAAFALPLTRPKVDFAALLGGPGAGATITPPVAIDDVVGCPRYQARVLDGVRVGPSPLWLRRRLEAVGVRPISNLVDVTNYVMFDRGQPLHAFDHAKVAGGAIVVRRARVGETLVTLDGVTRQLETSDVLICDAERPIALAGVMGGKDSEVSDGTTRVLLESACFEPRAVRVTAKRLGLHSEASQRFERGVDVAAVDASSQRACALLVEVAGGHVAGQGSDLWPRPLEPLMVPLRRARLHAVLGLDVGAPEVRRLLGGIELGDAGGVGAAGGPDPGPGPSGGEVLRFQIPTFRTDLTREVDLIEEVARLVGLDKLPATLPSVSRAPARSGDRVAERARELLATAGLHEILSYSFVAPAALAALGFADDDRRARPRRVANPLRLEQSAMRTAILPGLAAALAHNQSQRVHDVRLFEVGPLFLARAQGADDAELCDEPWVAGGLLAGDRDGWLRGGGPVDFFDARGVVDALVHGLTGHEAELAATSAVPWLHPGVAATVSVLGREVGVVGEVHPRVRDALGLTGAVFAFELGLDPLRSAPPAQLTRPGRFPGSSRDVSCFIAATVPAARVRSVLAAAGGALLAEIRLLEDYREAGKVPAGQKSMLWTLTYRSPERTLTDVEVDGAHAGVVAALAGQLSATLR